MKKIMNLFAAVSLLGLLACETEPSNNTKSDELNELVGTWYMPQRVNAQTYGKSASDISNGSLSSWNYETVVTTNSDQRIMDRYSEGIGGIEVSGAESATFTYMDVSQIINEFIGISLKENSFWDGHVEFPYYRLYLQQKWDAVQDSTSAYNVTATLAVLKDESTYISYTSAGAVDFFSYDGESLTVTEFSLMEKNGDGSVSIKGTLAPKFISIPANTPTVVNSFGENDVPIDQGGWTIEIRDDGSWLEIYQWEDFSDTLMASWEVDNDILTVIYDFTNSEDPANQIDEYVIEFNFKIENNELLLTSENDPCVKNLFPQDDCFRWVEDQYRLDRGSLESIVERQNLIFTQTPQSSGRTMVYEPVQNSNNKSIQEINKFFNDVQ
ncbi:hypothetical protein JYT44_03585 [Caldithrix abyssi]|nr:hypothetical protein [Caldithrix abyssi]